jgi:peptidoglycan/xylan/chitin deacetylase (PgdA/CDA1 family)
MYHYVHSPNSPEFDGLYGPSAQEFERQLLKIQSQYFILDAATFLAGLEGQVKLPRYCALITFDDGTVDHYRTVFPVLKRLNIPAVFFVITKCVQQRVLASVHARHLIAARIGEETLRREFIRRLEAQVGPIHNLPSVPDAVAQNAYRWDDLETARFKYAVNFGLPTDLRNRILCEIFETYVGDWFKAGNQFYATWEQLREMQIAGMHVGGHSHYHEPLGWLTPTALEEDIRQCHQMLATRLSGDGFLFSYPFGKAEHFSPIVIETLKRYGFRAAFTNLQGLNSLPVQVTGLEQYYFRRIDPKDLDQYLTRSNEFDNTGPV